MKAPIALFVFRRPDHTLRTLEALAKNHGASEHELHVFSDGPRNQADVSAIEEVRKICRNAKGFAKVHLHEKTENRGLARSIIAGVSLILESHERVIVMEDDLVTSPFFLSYMNEGLDRYANNSKVASIHGYVYPIPGLPPSFFVRGADCWGWATWKRAWKFFEPDASKLLQELEKRNATDHFDFEGSYPYTQMLKNQIEGRVDSWAIRWLASAYLNDLYTLYPGQTFVDNIGMDNSGTHTGVTDRYSSTLANSLPSAWPTEAAGDARTRRAFREYFLSLKPWYRRLAWRATHVTA